MSKHLLFYSSRLIFKGSPEPLFNSSPHRAYELTKDLKLIRNAPKIAPRKEFIDQLLQKLLSSEDAIA